MEERCAAASTPCLVDNKNLFIFHAASHRVASSNVSEAADIPPVIRGYHLCGCLPYEMPKHKSRWIATAVIILFLWPTASRAASPIAITEIAAYEPSGHEWIEIINTGASSTDLAGWKFFEDDTNHGLEIFRGNPSLGPSEFAVIAQNAEATAVDYPDFTGALFDSSWGSLNESGELIGLRDASGTLVGSFTYPEAHTASLERTDLHDLAEAADWHERGEGNSIGVAYLDEPAAHASPSDTTTSSTVVEVEVASSTLETNNQPATPERAPEPVIVRVPVYEPAPVPGLPSDLPRPRVPKPSVKTIKKNDVTIIVVEVPYVYERIIMYMPPAATSAAKESAKLRASAATRAATPKKKATKKKAAAAGPVMTIEGIVLEHASRNFIIEKGGDEIFVQLPTKASKRSMKVADGDRVRVTGIWKEESDGSWSMKMRGPKDLMILERATSTAIVAPKPQTENREPQAVPTWPYLGAAGIGSALLAGHLVRQNKKKKTLIHNA